MIHAFAPLDARVDVSVNVDHSVAERAVRAVAVFAVQLVLFDDVLRLFYEFVVSDNAIIAHSPNIATALPNIYKHLFIPLCGCGIMVSEVKIMDIKFANYGQERDVNATDEELKIFETLKETTGRDLRLVRKSDSYVTAALGEWDLARFKYTQRAKWVSFPTAEVGPPKHRISRPEDVAGFADLIAESLSVIEKY